MTMGTSGERIMSLAVWKRHLFATLLLLIGALILFEWTNIDLAAQDKLFRGGKGWLLTGKEHLPRLLFYSGIKVALVVLGAALAAGWLASFRVKTLRPYRARMLLMVLSMAIVPLLVSSLKQTTNVYCPYQLERYGGNKAYVKLFDKRPTGLHTRRGYGYPAGHASGGFSLMMLYFVFRSSRARALGLAAGLALGWIMGGYQMLRGAHFLSHTVITMLLAWFVILLLYQFTGREAESEPTVRAA